MAVYVCIFTKNLKLFYYLFIYLHIFNSYYFSKVLLLLLLLEMDKSPVAKVLSSSPVTLPVCTAILDGSHSFDDKGGITYLWTRDDNSPAAGVSLQ